MSMLSAQIDELRKAAEYYDGSEIANIMRYAADTIWQLRDDLQRTNAEADTLRTQLADVTVSMGRVEKRCAKLRELAARAWRLFTEHGAVHPCDLPEVDAVRDGLRELGIEVDE